MTGRRHRDAPSLKNLRKLHHQMPRWIIVLLIAGAAAVIASQLAHLLMMLILAAVASYILSSAVSAAERLGVKRDAAVILLFICAAAIFVSAHFMFVPYLKQEMVNAYSKIPEFSRRLQTTLLATAQGHPIIGEAIAKLAGALVNPGESLGSALNFSEILSQASSLIMGIILVPFFVFFLLKDWPGLMNKAMNWIPPSYVETTVSVVAEINILIGKYLRGLAADCFFVALIASTGLWLMGVNYPIILGVLSGTANIVPYFGPIIGCLASGFVALMQFNSFDAVLKVAILYVFIKLADDLFIQPLMIGKSVELHPMLLVITLIAGEKLFGISGMILGVPLVTIAQKTAGILLEHRREAIRRESSDKPSWRQPNKSPIRPI